MTRRHVQSLGAVAALLAFLGTAMAAPGAWAATTAASFSGVTNLDDTRGRTSQAFNGPTSEALDAANEPGDASTGGVGGGADETVVGGGADAGDGTGSAGIGGDATGGHATG